MDPSVSNEGDDNKVTEELKSLNQSFLSSVQEALASTPDACLAPLALDYLKFAYPLLKKGNDGGGDYLEGARFFANLKRNINDTSGGSPVPNKRSANGDLKVEQVKPSFAFQAPAAASASSVDEKKTPGPGFFGLGSSKGQMGSTTTTSPVTSVSKAPGGASATAVTTSSTTGFSFGEAKTGTNSTGSLGGSLFGQNKTETAASSTFSSNFFKPSSTSASLTATLPPPLFGTTTSSSTSQQKPGTSLFGGFQPSSSSGGFGFSSAPSTGMFSGFGSGPSGAKQPDSGPVNSSENNEDDEEEGETEPPPKPVVEDDAVYTQRIKLFEMVGKSFKDLGVSNLFVKPLPSGKHQLLVRADNSLGTILVNLILNSSVPVKQNKPTNIFITVPPSDSKQMTTYLLRVKDATQGNELVKEIEKYKALS